MNLITKLNTKSDAWRCGIEQSFIGNEKIEQKVILTINY